MSDAVLYEQNGRVVILTLNQPQTRNALGQEIVEALEAACKRVNEDVGVSCVILTGAGESFSSGGNIKNMRDRSGDMFTEGPAEIRRRYQYGIQRIPKALFDLEVPSIAAVNGHAIGAGCDTAMMCDMRIAADNAQFAESFLRVGLVPGDGGAWFLPKVVGMARANEMTYTCDIIRAEQAEKWGLVNQVVPLGSLMEETMKMAQRIAVHPPVSIRLCKKLMREAQHMSLPALLEMSAGMQAQVQSTEDHLEAVKAVLEKRKPVFNGK